MKKEPNLEAQSSNWAPKIPKGPIPQSGAQRKAFRVLEGAQRARAGQPPWLRLLCLAICSYKTPDWIGSFCGRPTVSHLSHGTMNRKMTMKTWRVTKLYPEQQHWRPWQTSHRWAASKRSAVSRPRRMCALSSNFQPHTVDTPETDTKWTQPPDVLKLEMSRTHAASSPTELSNLNNLRSNVVHNCVLVRKSGHHLLERRFPERNGRGVVVSQ